MKTIVFVYGHNHYEIEDYENNLESALKKYSLILKKDIKDLVFLNKGSILNLETIKELNQSKSKKIIILVSLVKNNKNIEKKELNDVLCPKCHTLSKMYINDDKISLKNCVNKHNILDININAFMNSQFKKDDDIKCFQCNNNIYLYNQFYICSCNKYVCQLCASKHDKNHYMIKYNERFYKCSKHNKKFISYCKTCNMNLCEKCEVNHKNKEHNKVLYKEIIPNPNKLIEINNEILEMEEKLKRYKFEINKLNNLYVKNMNNIIEEIDKYLLLYNYLKSSVGNLNNYERINNIINFKKKKFMKEIDNFLNDNIKNKYRKLIDIIDEKKMK